MGGRGGKSGFSRRGGGRTPFERSATVAIIENGKPNPYVKTEYDSESNYYKFQLWQKNDMNRIYVKDYKNRTVAYIDVNKGNEVVTDYAKGPVAETINWFLKNYKIPDYQKEKKKKK